MFINLLFVTSALLTVISALLVLFTKNLIHSCIYLLGTLFGVAGLYVTLGADFVAGTQIVVYVGGVVILLLFAVMLTGGKDFVSKAQALLDLVPSMGNKWSYFVGFFTAGVFGLITYKFICEAVRLNPVIENFSSFENTVEKIGVALITDHVLAFEISSVLLLGALVGAAVIARPRKESEMENK